MRHHHRAVRTVSLLAFSLFVTAVAMNGSAARAAAAEPPVTIQQLQGTWAITLTGVDGCGVFTTYATVTLSATGTGTANERYHSVACGDGTASVPFKIISLNPNGSGTAGLGCGGSCGFTFTIQVSRPRDEFGMIDLTDPGNYLEGTAIRQ